MKLKNDATTNYIIVYGKKQVLRKWLCLYQYSLSMLKPFHASGIDVSVVVVVVVVVFFPPAIMSARVQS